MDTLYKKLVPLAMAILLGQGLWAQTKVSKQIKEAYAMTDAGELHIENKYGDIKFYGWDKNEVSITIDIQVSHKKKENAEDLLERIRPILRNSDNYVSINYEIAEKSTSFFTKYFNKANPFDFDRSNVQIDYTIYLPVNAEIDVTNKFGDVIIEDSKGKLRVNMEHGDMWINEDLNNADVEMKYGKLRAKSVNTGNIRIKNGELDMETSKNLRLNSSGCDVTIDSVVSLEIYSNKDEISIEEVGAMYGSLKFTNFILKRLEADVDVTMKIANFRVYKILDPQADIAIAQESSEISIDVTGIPLHFEATLEQGLVRLPKSFKNVDSRMIDKSNRIREINATYGKNPQGKVSVNGLKGVVLLKEL